MIKRVHQSNQRVLNIIELNLIVQEKVKKKKILEDLKVKKILDQKIRKRKV